MIDQWFKKDLQNIFAKHPVAVFIDESGDAEFLLQTVENDFTIHRADSEIEELHVKYLIERQPPSQDKFLIYTGTSKKDLKFIREYCETHGSLEIRYLQNYIKDKVHQSLNLNINLSPEELIAAAKVSVGKDITYWIDISHKGATEIFDLNKELLPFIHDPELYADEKYDPELRETFYHKVNEMLGQDYLTKPAATLANEVVKSMLDGLADGNCQNKVLETVYKNWLDSVSFQDSFNSYLGSYSLPKNIDIWEIEANHPFRQIDEKWLADIGAHLSDKGALSKYLTRIKQRNQSKQAQALGIIFWTYVIELLEFDQKNIAYLSSFAECVEFYTKHFYKLDTAIRNLYTEFLSKKALLEPFQELYKEYVTIFLDKWFKCFSGYKETQTGTLQHIIDNNSEKIAIIIGDGIAYEIAEQVAAKVKNQLHLTRRTVITDIPSETENNMSRIYMDNGVVEAIQANRVTYLINQNPETTIDCIRLDEVNEEARPGQFLLCTAKDIDDMGEKLQQKALKYFPETISFMAEKINLLLSNGYAKVYLISDHGFILTGILVESDKIAVSLNGVHKKDERFIRSEDQQPLLTEDRYVEVEKRYKNFNYLYFAKNMSPFKTPGVYGFSHGGISPQELVTPNFCWERKRDPNKDLSISIINKDDLKNVTGELFQVKIKTDAGKNDLFTFERKVYLIFFCNKVQINKSDVFTTQKDELIMKEYTFDGNPEIEAQLLDAETKEQLDRAIIKQNNDRDLGGLL